MLVSAIVGGVVLVADDGDQRPQHLGGLGGTGRSRRGGGNSSHADQQHNLKGVGREVNTAASVRTNGWTVGMI